MSELANAVNRCAYWVEQKLGASSVFETLAYMGPSDLRYAIVFLAAVKCGYKLFVPSVRNPVQMNMSLLEQTKCTKFLYATEMSEKVHDLQAGCSKHYSYEATFPEARWDPVLILHSSGSTGLPKPIISNHATWAVIDNDRNLPPVPGRINQNYALWNFSGDGGRYFAAFPPFHLGGFVAMIVLPIYSTTATVVFGPADRPPSGHLASVIMQYHKLRALFCPPTIFEQLLQESEGLKQAAQLDFLLYAGGPLSPTTGDLLSKVTHVCQFYGSTEVGAVQALVPSREDWASLEWHPSWGADMQLFENNTFEMVLHRDPKLEGVRGFSCNFPDLEVYHTKDLFQPHRTKANLWQFYGRIDDVIVLSNGEKFNPVPSEVIIVAHPQLLGAVIVGQGRFQAALLVEPRDKGEIQEEALIEAIWPTVEQANAQAPEHARVTRSMIAVAHPTKPFERAGKGTVIRKLTAEKFAPEIQRLYSCEHPDHHGPQLAASHDQEAVHGYVDACVRLSFSPSDLGENDDLYVRGLDSLKSVEIVGILKAGISTSDTTWLSPRTIYDNPTIRKLSQIINYKLNQKQSSSERRVTQMASLVAQYTEGLATAPPEKNESLNPAGLNVAMTGSTGSLGSHLLCKLLNDSKVSRIFCLNHSADAKEKQEQSFATFGLEHSLNPSKVEFIQANVGEKHLGIGNAKYHELVSMVDIIVHNAWKVDFNHSLESFIPVHIQGVRNLVDWSISSSRHPHIVFVSSISSVGNWKSVYPDAAIPEELVLNHDIAQKMGYAESKNVAECILGIASKNSGVPVSILRVGQIAGPVAAASVWNRDEWFPSLIKTSQSFERLPRYLPDIDWIPVDSLAAAVCEISHFAATTGKSSVYNLVNPHTTSWTLLIHTVLARLGPQVRTIDLSE
ncbi:hypothetical protein MMC26_000060 [Xylographa opegraphella]|nr:hypothetical protein [Xylographa opegraphella]